MGAGDAGKPSFACDSQTDVGRTYRLGTRSVRTRCGRRTLSSKMSCRLSSLLVIGGRNAEA